MPSLIAEVIAVGDEMTSGQRLDTNTQWLAANLNELGITVEYHSTVGDDLQRQTDVIRTAAARANVVVITGGLGPTQDDLTRQAIADAAEVTLETDEAALRHIESIFAKNKREMSDINRRQAQFPSGGSTIHNEEGTAPGVDFECCLNDFDTDHRCRIFALPGVPYEMKQMWTSWVEPQVSKMVGGSQTIVHHVVKCFGVGESQAESIMPGLIARDRKPRVGITASHATISFRIMASAESEQACREQISPTVDFIRETLGEIVFGEGDITLQDVVVQLLCDLALTVSIVDFQFGNAAASLLGTGKAPEAQPHPPHPLVTSIALQHQTPVQWTGTDPSQTSITNESVLHLAATKVREETGADIGVAVGPLFNQSTDGGGGDFEVWISGPELQNSKLSANREFRFGGHSSMRDVRSAKQVLNFLRLNLRAIKEA